MWSRKKEIILGISICCAVILLFIFLVISFGNTQEVPLAEEVQTTITVRSRTKEITYSLEQLQIQIERADRAAQKFREKEKLNKKHAEAWEARAKSLRALLPVVEKESNKIYNKERK